MKIIYLLPSLFILLFIFNACKPPHHPKNPKYEIIKPDIKYTPSKKNLEKMVKELQGSPYVWAEEGPDNFDCSGFTYYMYGSMGIEIPRVAREQAKQGKIIKADELIYGDLIFFDTNKRHRGRITHVGVYLGNGWFTHASTVKHEIIYSNINTSTYYKKRMRICRRYLPETKSTYIAKQEAVTPWKIEKNEPIKSSLKDVSNNPLAMENSHMKDIGSFYIQVGSFSGKPHQSLLDKIMNLGYNYRLIEFPMNGKKISKLLIGPYKTRESAKKILLNVHKQIQKSAFIAMIK